MNFEALCGTEDQCDICPFSRAEEQRAQELSKIVACFEGISALPNDKTINRIAELADIEVDKLDIIKINDPIVQMTIR